MTARRRWNPGKREREAGKRHRRAVVTCDNGAEATTLKLGRKHFLRFYSRIAMAVADPEKLATGAQESGLQHQRQKLPTAQNTFT